jgi:hypothetical protein
MSLESAPKEDIKNFLQKKLLNRAKIAGNLPENEKDDLKDVDPKEPEPET